MYKVNFAAVKAIADTLRALKIHWLMVNTPMSPYYKHTPNYTCEGPSWPTARAVLADMAALDSANEYFHLYDANVDGNHDYGPADAADEFHLSITGADKLTRRLDSIVHTFLH